MAQLNANTPYIQCFIRNKYIFGPEDDGLTEGYIFGVKSMITRPMHLLSIVLRGDFLADADFGVLS